MHWVLDVVFNEDGSGIRHGNAPANMAIVRRFVLNILNQIKTKKETSKNVKCFADALIKTN